MARSSSCSQERPWRLSSTFATPPRPPGLDEHRDLRLSREIFFLLAFAALVAGVMALVAANAAVDVVKGSRSRWPGGRALPPEHDRALYACHPSGLEAGRHTDLFRRFLSLFRSRGLDGPRGRLIFVPLAVLFVFLELAGSPSLPPATACSPDGRVLLSVPPKPVPPSSSGRIGARVLGFDPADRGPFLLEPRMGGPGGVFAVSAAMILAGQAVRRFLFYGLLSNRAAEAGSPFTEFCRPDIRFVIRAGVEVPQTPGVPEPTTAVRHRS